MNKDIFSLEDKVIIVTGACGFLGRKHAEAIASYGGTPILIDLSEKAVSLMSKEINDKYDVNSQGYKVDITNEVMVEKNSKEIMRINNQIDGLVNNAANNPKVDKENTNLSRLESFSLEAWEKDIAVGLTGAYLCTKYYGSNMAKNNTGGSIVNISSDLGLIAPDQNLYANNSLTEDKQPVKPVTYSVVKTGLIGLTRYTSTYWANKKVRCNAICPGGVEDNQPKEFIQKISKKIPLGRLAKPDELQGVLVWMLSEASSYLNGAIIPIDGGRTAW